MKEVDNSPICAQCNSRLKIENKYLYCPSCDIATYPYKNNACSICNYPYYILMFNYEHRFTIKDNLRICSNINCPSNQEVIRYGNRIGLKIGMDTLWKLNDGMMIMEVTDVEIPRYSNLYKMIDEILNGRSE